MKNDVFVWHQVLVEVKYPHQIHTLDRQLDEMKSMEGYDLKIFMRLLDYTKVEEEQNDDEKFDLMVNRNVQYNYD